MADGAKLWVAYYDRSYGNCESTGCNDITLAGIDNPASASPTTKYTRLTTSSMPNLVPANNPLQAGFLGDYMWVTVDHKGRAHVVWGDTRGLNGAVEEDILRKPVSNSAVQTLTNSNAQRPDSKLYCVQISQRRFSDNDLPIKARPREQRVRELARYP